MAQLDRMGGSWSRGQGLYSEYIIICISNTKCDFLVKEKEKVVLAVQSCWELNNENQDRELKGIQNALKDTGATRAAIITYNQEDRLDGIDLIPLWKWI
jgi:predicted AAA+ superfamily ATPase